MDNLNFIKKVCREEDAPYFTDEELQFYLDKNNQDVNATIYECLIIKSQDTSIKVSGLETTDTSKYFRRLAAMYRPSNSGVLQ